MILIYAFSNQWGTNISRRTLLELQSLLVKEGVGGDFVFHIIHFHPRSFFNKYLKNNVYDLIIGLGDYRNSSRIRIETRAKNNYQDQEIYPFSPFYLDISLPVIDNYQSDTFKISANMGTYNCNWMAYSTELLIQQKKLNTKHLFLHLSQKSSASDLASKINDLLIINHLI